MVVTIRQSRCANQWGRRCPPQPGCGWLAGWQAGWLAGWLGWLAEVCLKVNTQGAVYFKLKVYRTEPC
eukprot:10978509-Heterocapsa_arctica.AAC.1